MLCKNFAYQKKKESSSKRLNFFRLSFLREGVRVGTRWIFYAKKNACLLLAIFIICRLFCVALSLSRLVLVIERRNEFVAAKDATSCVRRSLMQCSREVQWNFVDFRKGSLRCAIDFVWNVVVPQELIYSKIMFLKFWMIFAKSLSLVYDEFFHIRNRGFLRFHIRKGPKWKIRFSQFLI